MKQNVKADNTILDENQEKAHPVTVDNKVVAIDAKAALKNSKKSKKGKKKLVILLIFLLAAGGVGYKFYQDYNQQQLADLSSTFTEYTVELKTIQETLSGSGTLEPADSYTVSTLVTGEVLEANFEEGDVITKDTLLYAIDSSEVASNLEKAQMSLEQSQVSYNRNLSSFEDLEIRATESGKITELLVEVGDTVNAGETIATIMDKEKMALTVPFSVDDAAGITVGQTAAVTIVGSYETLSGIVSQVSTIEEVSTGNTVVKNITIDVQNPGGIATTTSATAMVGQYACTAEGTFDYKASATVVSTISGEVESISVAEGDSVSEDETLVTLTSESLNNSVEDAQYSIKSAQMTLDSQADALDDYQILSPIAGTIVEKNVKKGDTLSDGVTLCTIFDLSYLTMTLSVDELDIGKVSVGQQVDITADAVEGKSYVGTITKININGTTASGVTSYPVTVRIDETDGLLPGMNVDVEIVVASSENVAAVPVGAIERGKQVLVKTADAATDAADAATAENPATAPNAAAAEATDSTIPAGYAYREVTTGISDEDYIEITDGLSEGDTVAIMETVVPESSTMMLPGTGAGRAGGGERPSGGEAPAGGGF